MTTYQTNMRKIYFASFCLLFFLHAVKAQQSNVKLFSVNFQQATISQVVNEIESKSSYHFYYDPAQFDSLRVTVQVTEKPLSSILDQAFKKTAFVYSISQCQVFITKNRQKQTEQTPRNSRVRSNEPPPETAAVTD